MSKQISTRRVAAFFAVLTCVGLIASMGYGMLLDGPSEQVILQENLKEYAILLFGMDSEPVRGYDALDIQRITESIEMDHGQALYYPAAPLLALKNNNPYGFNILWHAYTWLWFMAGVLAVYVIMRSLSMSRIIACTTALLFYLSPRFFAEGHYNNKDILLLSLTLWTIAAGIRFWQKPTFRRAVWFGLAGALAANIRIIGVFVFGVMGVTAVTTLAARGKLRKSVWGKGLAAIMSFIVIYMLITPAFLINPAGYIHHVLHNTTEFSRWDGLVIFKGTAYDPAGGLSLPHSYLPTMIAFTTPIPVLVLAAIGTGYAVYLCITGDERRPALLALMLLFLVPLCYAVLAQPLMYNGWRHFYFLYGPILVMAGFGLRLLQLLFCKRRAGKIACTAVLTGALLWQGIGIACNYPYEYAYYNELAGTVQGQFELDYWEVSTLSAIRQLAESEERNPALPLVIGGGDHMSAFSLLQNVKMLPAAVRTRVTVTEEEAPPYLFSNTTYAQIYNTWPGAAYQPLFSIQSYGNVLCTMYERRP